MKKKMVGIAVTALLVASSVVKAESPEPHVTADAAVVMEIRTAQVLYEKKAHQPRHPASITKILTGIMALEMGNLEDIVKVSRRAAYVEGSSMGLKPGQEYLFGDLVSALLIMSANDSAVAIAEHLGGSVEGFANMMNEKALSIGAFNTNFKNPHGISREGHLTTAYDIALMARYALQNPEFARRVATKERDIWRLDEDIQVRLRNTNQLLWSYLGADGVKTGTTTLAGKCLVASASRGDMQLLVVVMHSDRRWEDAADLLEWGFENFEITEPLNPTQVVHWLDVNGGVEREVPLMIEGDIVAVVPKGEAEGVRVRCEVLPRAAAPIDEGEPLGNVYLLARGERVASALLIAQHAVPRKTFIKWFLSGLLPLFRAFLKHGIR